MKKSFRKMHIKALEFLKIIRQCTPEQASVIQSMPMHASARKSMPVHARARKITPVHVREQLSTYS
jgi:hypothetical protein